MQAQLDGYAEQGASAELLTFAAMKFHSLGGTAGLRGSYDIPMSWGVLTPNARVEYRQTIDGAFQQSMYYTDLGPSMTSTLGAGTTTRGTINTSLGVRARSLARRSAASSNTAPPSGAGKVQSQTVRAGLKVAF